MRDGGIDPANLGKGDWIYYVSMATNKLGGNVPAVTNEHSLMQFYRSMGIRYVIVKAATSDVLFNGTYGFPQFTRHLVQVAHEHGLLIFGYNRSYGSNILGEIAISDYVFQQGADGFVWDAEAEWESDKPWIGTNGPALAWQLCSAVRSNWPNKFLAHAPFPIISYHTSFPYKEFGYWCDAVMPQIYPQGWTGVKSRPSGGINWTDVNWRDWQNSLAALPPTNINGLTVYWTNAIKPLAPVNHVYGPKPPNSGVTEIPPDFVMEFLDYLGADPNCVTAGGYRGASFWRADLHGAAQWTNIGLSTIGTFPGVVNNVVVDSGSALATGDWTLIRVFDNGRFYGSTETNTFGTDYFSKSRGTGDAWVEFRPRVEVAGDYDLYQRNPTHPQASAAVPFLVRHRSGETTVWVNQQTNAGRWTLLGRFSFDAGTAGVIRVLDSIPEADKLALADAVKLVTPPPAAPTDLVATPVGPKAICLEWTDNSPNEASFVISRGVASGGPYEDVATVPADRTDYVDSNLSTSFTYYYVVRAVNHVGASALSPEASATTGPVTPQPPVITKPPTSQIVCGGQPVTFTVGATGTPPLRYQWTLNGEPLAGGTRSSLTLPAVTESDLGDYAVQVTNAYGSVFSAVATLELTTLRSAGDNSFDQLAVRPGATHLVAVAGGAGHTLALREDGVVLAWGNNWNGQCDVPANLPRVVALAAGGYHSLAVTDDGRVVAWGAAADGQCDVPAGLERVLAVAAGTWHSLALTETGQVFAWGDDRYGQCRVPTDLNGVMAIAAGGNHSLALRTNGQVVAWGQNTDAQGNWCGQSVVPAALSNVVGIAAGDYHSLALTAEGSVVAWGDNARGQIQVPAGLGDVVALSAGAAHTVALRRDGRVVVFGDNSRGQCDVSADWVASAVAAGGWHTLVLLDEGIRSPRLFRVGPRAGGFGVVLQSKPRCHYALEWTHTLSDQQWSPFPAVNGGNGLLLLADPAADAGPRFYRVRVW